MKTIINFFAVALIALVFAGCEKDDPTHTVRFFLENPSAGRTGVWAKPLTLEGSGLTYYVKPDPLITEANITNIQLVKVQSGHMAFLFHLDEFGTRALYRASVADNGRMLILVVNGNAIGARQLDGSISDGRLYTFTELSDEEMEKLYEELVDNTAAVQELKRHHGY
ncbi:hypothetical protein [Rubellicoccus peritrichatus]|uniref:DUF4825 domain-containing protein n=1 Tax=Rubellicoccus peritrichatus TaxID=3080537 RepID=A0AAQ3LBU2_9BACT|nr:hypothetical protein [Puniceicoccus sp. CR14]WOO43214.1 hypothetical protein RZN69_08920 [Puniceicoccus sp. CR14]